MPPKYQEHVPPYPISVSDMFADLRFKETQRPRMPLIAISFEVRIVI
jgi:hypothetical protein